MGAPRDRVRCIHDGIEPESLRGRLRRAPRIVRAALAASPDTLLVAVVGHLRSWKGQDVVVEAVKRLEPAVSRHLLVLLIGVLLAAVGIWTAVVGYKSWIESHFDTRPPKRQPLNAPYIPSPQDVVDICRARDIPIISWTYNDPVVWHEFVMDTSGLAQKHGILTLYKSAFYISPEAVDELVDVIDVFSLSLKSMDPEFYRRLTKGTLEPVLAAIERVARSGRHLEISNLLVTDANDGEDDARKVADWVLGHHFQKTRG